MTKQAFSAMTILMHRRRPLQEQIDEVDRELSVRKRIYDKWVAEGKVSWTEANDRMERLLSAKETLLHIDDPISTPPAAQNPNIPQAEAQGDQYDS